MKVCVLGTGSLGSTIGGALAKAGNEVHFVGRKAHMDAVNENGLVMVTPTGEETVHPIGHETPDGIGACDLVIVLCKAFDTKATMEEGLELVGPDTMVMSLQNGLGAEDVLSEVVGAEHVIGGKTYIGGMLLGPGRVQATIPGKDTLIGELDGTVTDRVKAVGQAFNDAGMHCIVSDNIMGVIWDKLLVNVATGAICGVTRLPYGDMYQEGKLVATSCAAVQEGMDVAAAAGIKLSYKEPMDAVELAREGLPYDFKPSILQSLEKHRPTEVSVINGAVVAQGKKHGVPTPVNETLEALVKGVERYISEYVNK